MRTANLLKTAAIAGLLGLGISGVITTSATARDYRVCDSYGCRWAHEPDGYGYDQYNGSHYNAPSY